jgi:cytochrome c-type biogenesis protein CcmF
VLDFRRRDPGRRLSAVLSTLRARRRQYAGFLVHLGFVALAVGVTGSSLGTRECELDMRQGETVEWAGYTVRFSRLIERDLPGKIVVEARLDVARSGTAWCTLLPAQHFYRLQRHWAGRAAIHATWTRDLYTILHRGEGSDRIHVTLIENPLMRWIWLGGGVVTAGALIGLIPAGRAQTPPRALPPPHTARRTKRIFPHSFANRR